MTEESKNIIPAVTNLVIGLFMMTIAPYLATSALSIPVDRLVNVFQVVQPEGTWISPVVILTVTYHVWLTLYIFAGAFLIILSKFIYERKEWAAPASVTLFAIPSIGGMTMTIPWIVLVLNGPIPTSSHSISTDYACTSCPSMSPAAIIMLLGLVGYFILLFTTRPVGSPKHTKQQIIAKSTVFTLIGVVAGFTWMNAQHGVRYFMERPGVADMLNPFISTIDPANSNPEMFMGGFVMYAVVIFFLPAIYWLAKKDEKGIWLATGLTLMTISINLSVFFDRIDQPSGLDWLKGAALSIVLMVVLLLPYMRDGVYERDTAAK